MCGVSVQPYPRVKGQVQVTKFCLVLVSFIFLFVLLCSRFLAQSFGVFSIRKIYDRLLSLSRECSHSYDSSVKMADALWEDRDVRFDISSQ